MKTLLESALKLVVAHVTGDYRELLAKTHDA
jgi:hypothetical protein